ncbi:MAG TPA: alkaline phosphatase family protein [Verrucomicrobiae bacterium]|nr:alkaline phosphatase family protein [Verrucomicrobiae bacterium]
MDKPSGKLYNITCGQMSVVERGRDMAKKVILFIIDSLHPAALEAGFALGTAPAMSFLAQNGHYHNDCVSSFPTMTPVATSSIVTGMWPDKHHVPGFIWYNPSTKWFVNYGATWHAILKMGPDQILKNILKNLNAEHLNPKVPTVYEKLGEHGLLSGVINFFIHRAKLQHQAKVPFLLRMLSHFKFYDENVGGPEILTLGELLQPSFTKPFRKLPVGPLNRFGFNDIFSGKIAANIIAEGKQPDFLLVYLPDNDKYSHVRGPLQSLPAIARADRQIRGVLDALGPWNQALEDNVFIVMGDHSQTTIGKNPENIIDLDKVLGKFQRLALRNRSDENTELALCPNERMAIIYILKNKRQVLEDVAGVLAADPRHTQIAWREKRNCYKVIQGGSQRVLSFWRKGPHADIHGNMWGYEGELGVMDAKLDGQGNLVFGDYPDAFCRLQSALDSRQGTRIILSAAPGYEYKAEGAPIHPGGGSHGSLEKEDSHVPLIIAGTPKNIANPRIIDIFPFVLDNFEIVNG